MWNPSSSRLASLEQDEAGRLAAFRAKFGRGFDTNTAPAGSEAEKTAEAEAAQAEAEEEDDNLLDLISSFGQQEAGPSEKKKKW